MKGYDLELQGGYQCSVDVLPTAISHIDKKTTVMLAVSVVYKCKCLSYYT